MEFLTYYSTVYSYTSFSLVNHVDTVNKLMMIDFFLLDVSQLNLILDLLGTPRLETVNRIGSQRARDYINGLPKKAKVPFKQVFPMLIHWQSIYWNVCSISIRHNVSR